MIQESYVTFEQAKALKELGFPQINQGYGDEDNYIACASQSLVQKWLREEKNLHIQVSIDYLGKYYGVFYDTKSAMGTILNDTDMFEVYEQALSAGIDKCIELLRNK